MSTKRPARQTPATAPAADPNTIAAEMAGAALTTLDTVLQAGDNERRFAALIAACERAWLMDQDSRLNERGVEEHRKCIADALPNNLRTAFEELEEYHSDEANIYAEAGFRLGLAVARGGAR